MLPALRFNYDRMPAQLRLPMGFMAERRLIYEEIRQAIEVSQTENWLPLNSLILQFIEVYQLQIDERQELTEILLQKAFNTKAVSELQNLFQVIVRITDAKQKYFNYYRVDYVRLHQFMERHFLSNEDRTVCSQSYSTSMFHEFCAMVKSLQYFFDESAVAFAFKKFKESMGASDKQLAWAYLTMFCPFRCDIPESAYGEMLDYIMDAEILDTGEKENCRLRFILNYMRVYPMTPRSPELVTNVLKTIHQLLRVDSNQDEKGENLMNTMLPDDVLDVESVYKLIPKLIVEMIGSSKRPGYQEYMLQLKRLFQLFDSIMSVYNSQTWDDTLFKLIKLTVSSFVYKYRRDRLITQITELASIKEYDEQSYQDLLSDMVQEYNGTDIVDYIESDRHWKELFYVNPDQGYQAHCKRYPVNEKPPKQAPKKYKYPKIQDSLLDKQAKDDFLSLVLGLLDKIVFMEDNGISIVKTALFITQFEPECVEFFLQRLDIAFTNLLEVASPTLKNILILIANPLLRNPKYQLSDLFKYMEQTYRLFEQRGVQENVDSIELYERVLLANNCYTPEELVAKYPELQGSQAVQDSEFLSAFISDLFKLIIKNMHVLHYKENESSSILFNLSTLFWSLVCNCSDGVIHPIVDFFITHVEYDLDSAQFQFMGDILDSLVYRCPNRILPAIIEIVFDKLIRIKTKPHPPHYFDFLMDDEIAKYEQNSLSVTSKKMWLTLLEKTLSQAGKYVKNHFNKLMIIIVHYLIETEDEIFEKICDIIHSISITNLLIVAKDFRSYKDLVKIHDPKEPAVNNFSCEWRFPDDEDFDFADKVLDIFFHKIRHNFESEYFKDDAYKIQSNQFSFIKVPQNFQYLADKILFETQTNDPKLRQKCYRMWFVMFATFSGTNIMIPLENNEESKLKEQIQTPYLDKIRRLKIQRSEIAEFVKKAIVMSIETGIIHDQDLNDMIFYMCSQTVGCSVLNNDIQASRDYLNGARSLQITTKNRIYFDNRMELIADIQQYSYKRHLFLVHLQGAPRYFIELYQYVMALALAKVGDYQFPNFLMPFSKETTYDLTYSIRIMLLDYVCQVLDHTNPQSRLNQINNSSPHLKSKGYKIIQQLLKALHQSCENIPSNMGLDIRLHQRHHQLINCLDHLDNKACKTHLFESSVKVFILAYDQNTFKVDQDRDLRLEMLSQSAKQMTTTIFWKCKLVHTLVILNNLNILGVENIPDNIIDQVAEAFRVNCLEDNIHLNAIGRVGFFYLMREVKRYLYKKTTQPVEGTPSTNLKEFLTWRFLPMQEVRRIEESYKNLAQMEDLYPGITLYRARNPDTFLLCSGDITKVEIVHHESYLIKSLRTLFTDKIFVTQFLERTLQDKDVQPTHEFSTSESVQDSQDVQFMNARGILKYIQILLSYVYIKDKKKTSPFSCTQSFFMADFYSRFFKKIFQVCGRSFFEASREVIDEFATHIDQKEKQRMMTFYVGGLQRSLLPVGNYAQEKFVQVLPYISQEVFTENHVILFFICKNQDWAYLEKFIRPCLDCCKKFSGDSGVRGFRYLHLLKLIIETQVTRAYQLREECFKHLEILLSDTWLSSTHIDENVAFLSVFLLVTLSFPIPKGILPPEQSLIQMSSQFVYAIDEESLNFFKRLNQVLITSELTMNDSSKAQQELAIKLLEQIHIKQINKFSWVYIGQAISTIFENNSQNIDVDTMEILRKQVGSEFTPEVEEELFAMLQKKSNSENFLVRKKVNFFLRDWYFLKLLCSDQNQFKPQIPPMLLKFIDDKHPQIQTQAMHSVSDLFKVFLPKELTEMFQTALKMTEETAVVILMAMLLSRMDRTFEWTNEALTKVLKAYQKLPSRKKLIQEFVSEYWKTRQDNLQVFQYQINDENLQMLREIVNPYSYFA